VIAVSWQYAGLNPTEMEGRITTVYERLLTTTVDNVEHIESTTINGTAVVKIYLHPNASVDRANAQVTAISQTVISAAYVSLNLGGGPQEVVPTPGDLIIRH
jgi:multidrug efflux pump subunit AcrB